MLNSLSDLTSILERLQLCDNAQAVFDIVDAYGKSLGFEVSIMAICGRLIIKSESVPPFLTSASPEWVARYMELDLYSLDPITQMAMRTCRPFTYEEAYLSRTPEVEMYKREATAHGVEFGWAVPVHKVGIAPGIVSYAGRTKVALSSTEAMHMAVVCMMAFERASIYFSEMVPELGLVLSDRERSVLTLVARGKTNWEIGTVLSISEYSVRDYLKALSVKLRTSNRAHSVARAMQLGLIVP